MWSGGCAPETHCAARNRMRLRRSLQGVLCMLGCSYRLALAKPGQTAGLAAGNAMLMDGGGLSTREAERCMRSRD